ncbi:MAG: CehA/McbA family metallohydrolase [Chloroflexota bacterium]
MSATTLYEYIGNLHMHTPYSDGVGSHAEIADAALIAGIDIVIVTDHNVLVQGVEGYYGDDERGYILLLTGEEIHDQARMPQVNHFLVYGAEQELAQCARNPQELIDAVNVAGGMGFIAHPHDPPLDLVHEPPIPWVDWSVQRYTGLEIWNYMSSFKGLLPTWKQLLYAVFRPEEVMIGPYPETLALWDRLLTEGYRVIGIGNSDAHGTVYQVGLLRHVVFPYDFLFNCVNTHLLLPQPLSGNWQSDKQALYKALAQGNAFIGYDIPGSTRGFRFSANGQFGSTIMGGSIRLGPGVTLQVLAPARCHIKIISGGKVVAESEGRENLTFTAQTSGAYRAEVWQQYHGQERAWILSNPIYIEDNAYTTRT